jgi:pyruvate kinase
LIKLTLQKQSVLSVARAAKNLGVKTIVAATESGYTAKMISKYRPDADILAVTFDERTKRGLMLTGVFTQQLLKNLQQQMKCLN